MAAPPTTRDDPLDDGEGLDGTGAPTIGRDAARRPATAPWTGAERREELRFLRRVLIVLGVVALALLAWAIREALLLALGAVVVAVLLCAAERRIRARTG